MNITTVGTINPAEFPNVPSVPIQADERLAGVGDTLSAFARVAGHDQHHHQQHDDAQRLADQIDGHVGAQHQ